MVRTSIVGWKILTNSTKDLGDFEIFFKRKYDVLKSVETGRDINRKIVTISVNLEYNLYLDVFIRKENGEKSVAQRGKIYFHRTIFKNYFSKNRKFHSREIFATSSQSNQTNHSPN